MTQPTVLIGFDLGTTALKAATFDLASGQVLAVSAHRLETRTEADGTREQEVLHLRDALARVARDLRQRLGEAVWQGVRGLGLAAQGGSGALLERRTGAAQTPLYLWNDSRAASLLPEVSCARSSAYWRELAQRRGPGHGLARMLWLQRRQPGCFAGDVIYAGAGEIAYFLMTGTWRQDACNALQMGCYDVLHNRIDSDPLSVVGVALSQVAPLRPGHATESLSPAGAQVLGLPPGLPVAGPYMDHEAGYLSAAGLGAHPLQCSLGTAWVGNFVMPDPRCGWSPVQLVIASPVPGTGSLVIQPLLTGNVSWDWGLGCFVGPERHAALAQAEALFAARLLPPPGMTCIPWFTQANPWAAGTSGGGVFAGVSAHSTPPDFLRALALGLCCEFYRVFRELKERRVVDAVILSGGASKGPYFQTLLAALFSPVPVLLCADEDVGGARGALAAFSESLVRSRAVPVAPPEAKVAQAVQAAFLAYCATFAGTYAAHPAAAPYRLT